MDSKFMKEAIEEAKKAFLIDEVPIGAVAVVNGEIVARSFNLIESMKDATKHAEILLINELSGKYGRRLTDVTIYVTIEPCIMCVGAMIQSRIKRLVYGARDEKFGGVRSLYEIASDDRLNHQIEVEEGIYSQACAKLMKDFFKRKRKTL